MSYKINATALKEVALVPARVPDKLIKLSSEFQLKVLLVALRLDLNDIDPLKIAQRLCAKPKDVEDSLAYWVECGILLSENLSSAPEISQDIQDVAEPVATVSHAKPTREDVLMRGTSSPEVAFMLREAQMKFGRPLKQNESATLLWLYDDEKMQIAVILLLIAFATSENKTTASFIERTALSWIKSGVKTVEDAEREIFNYHTKKSAWGIVEKSFGIAHRKPSAKESDLACKWVEEYKFGSDILKAAYDMCVDTTSKFSLPYISKILENWHRNNVKTVEDAKKLSEKSEKTKKSDTGFSTYNLESYNASLDILPD